MEQWPPWEVKSLAAKLDSLAALLDPTTQLAHTEEVSGWLARLLVVRSCGYLEQTVAEVSRAYVDERSGGLVRTFARSWLERSGNPGPDRLENLLGRFDKGLRDEFAEYLDADDQRVRRQLAFLVDRRNRIAHGLNEGVAGRKALELKSEACEVADWFILRMNPGR